MAQASNVRRLTPAAGDVLRRGPDSGQRPTVKDVARLAGVSAMTVSRVINDGSCSVAAREAVQRAIAMLGYEPNIAARALAASRQGGATRSAPAGQAGMPQALQAYSRMISRLLKPAD